MNIPLKRQIELHQRRELHVFLVQKHDIPKLYEYFLVANESFYGASAWPANEEENGERLWYVRPPIWKGQW